MTRFLKLSLFSLLFASLVNPAWGWDPAEIENLDEKAQEAKSELLADDADMQRFFDSAQGYVVIPTVGKAGFGIGGARGTGLLYEGGQPAAKVTLTQLTVGLQWGGQAYSEFLFFKDQEALDDFKKGGPVRISVCEPLH